MDKLTPIFSALTPYAPAADQTVADTDIAKRMVAGARRALAGDLTGEEVHQLAQFLKELQVSGMMADDYRGVTFTNLSIDVGYFLSGGEMQIGSERGAWSFDSGILGALNLQIGGMQRLSFRAAERLMRPSLALANAFYLDNIGHLELTSAMLVGKEVVITKAVSICVSGKGSCLLAKNLTLDTDTLEIAGGQIQAEALTVTIHKSLKQTGGRVICESLVWLEAPGATRLLENCDETSVFSGTEPTPLLEAI